MKFLAFCASRKLVTVLTQTHFVLRLSQMNPVHALQSHFNIHNHHFLSCNRSDWNVTGREKGNAVYCSSTGFVIRLCRGSVRDSSHCGFGVVASCINSQTIGEHHSVGSSTQRWRCHDAMLCLRARNSLLMFVYIHSGFSREVLTFVK